MTMNIFEKATKNAIRFDSVRGNISTEDLWNLDVVELDSIFKKLNASKKSLEEDSLLEVKTSEDTLVNTKINIIKHIVEYKLAEKEARANLLERKARKQEIMEALEGKEKDALTKKTPAQLRKMLNEL